MGNDTVSDDSGREIIGIVEDVGSDGIGVKNRSTGGIGVVFRFKYDL
jgi:hypothetical protein